VIKLLILTWQIPFRLINNCPDIFFFWPFPYGPGYSLQVLSAAADAGFTLLSLMGFSRMISCSRFSPVMFIFPLCRPILAAQQLVCLR